MSMTTVKVKEWGNSLGVIIPKEIVEHVSLHAGDEIKIDIIKNKRIDGFGMFKNLPRFKEEREEHEDFW